MVPQHYVHENASWSADLRARTIATILISIVLVNVQISFNGLPLPITIHWAHRWVNSFPPVPGPVRLPGSAAEGRLTLETHVYHTYDLLVRSRELLLKR